MPTPPLIFFALPAAGKPAAYAKGAAGSRHGGRCCRKGGSGEKSHAGGNDFCKKLHSKFSKEQEV